MFLKKNIFILQCSRGDVAGAYFAGGGLTFYPIHTLHALKGIGADFWEQWMQLHPDKSA